MSIIYDRKVVLDAVRGPVFGGHLFQAQVEGIDGILSQWERLQPEGDARFVSYMLATTAWETAHSMRPVEEYGHGRGRAYGAPAGPWHQVYDGRGDVQLTWEANYRKATLLLRAKGVIGTDIDLEKTPALALRSDIAAAIMFFGMIEGWFTGRKLSDYFHGAASDWINARRIINGLDQAETIASYGEHFYAGLKAGLTKTDAVVAEIAPLAPAAIAAKVVAPEAVPAPAKPKVIASASPAPAPVASPATKPAPGILSRIASLFVG